MIGQFTRTLTSGLRRLNGLLARVRAEKCWVPPGHFYSPIPDTGDLKRREDRIWGNRPRQLPGLDLNEQGQLDLFDQLKAYYADLPFDAQKSPKLRYHYENDAYSYGDAIILFCMLRHLRPRRVVEVGSGYSSCAILDTNELFFDDSIACTFIEPAPRRLLSLVGDGDRDRFELLEMGLQDVEPGLFGRLSAGDVLLIDSSHVAKTGSDVNHAVFNVLPALAAGVFVHFHDVMYPFEYPRQWVYQGRAWNETYLLRAFLQYNHAFRIQFFSSFLAHFHAERFSEEMPLWLRNPGGSIWLEKL